MQCLITPAPKAPRMSATRTRRQDYLPPDFLIDTVDLRLDLDPEATIVRARLSMRRNPAGRPTAALRLDSDQLTLLSIALDGTQLKRDQYTLHGDGILELATVPDAFALEIETYISPQANTKLSGLYTSGGAFFTQCEAEGFRRITYFLDRPDVMARFTTTLRADRAAYPVLLSNGNPDGTGVDGDRHWARWVDPHPKPSYLFALVAGDLVSVQDRFTTKSGRDVTLGIWVREGDQDRCGHAMQALKDSMRWDEEKYGLEYDLDVFNIAAVSDFNMGAMENKGLNIFNTKYVLASDATATDSDLHGVAAVIAHEYFHNWTGNRITCRDWFQLSLKEGLTVFRDQQFSADHGSPAVERIRQVRTLRARQFSEDAGPLSHPVRPDEYLAIDNFYTATIYEKGAEIVRMIHNCLGADGFRRGMDEYISRNDNQAVTIEGFVEAMALGTPGSDVRQFLAWYGQPGTPELAMSEEYDGSTYTLTLRQTTRGAPLPIPVKLGLLGANGHDIETRDVLLTETETRITFANLAQRPVPSLLRGFSAPVRLRNQPHDQLLFLARHDSDPFMRWDASQQIAVAAILAPTEDLIAGLIAGLASALANPADPAFTAELLALPAEAYVGDQMAIADPDLVHENRTALRRRIGSELHDLLARTCDTIPPDSPGKRALRNVCLVYLAAAGDLTRTEAQFAQATTMTDSLAALDILVGSESPQRPAAIATFYARWQHDPLVLDKWFTVQAMAPRADAIETIRSLLAHPDFDLRNPNRARSLIGGFCANLVRFHTEAGYRFLADMVIALDAINGQVAARMIDPLTAWRRQNETRASLMKSELRRILAGPSLSRDTLEKATKALG